MKRKFTVLAGLIIACLCLSHVLSAQEKEEENEIKISITKNVNGETKSFEKTYQSATEMKNDKELKEFSGDDTMDWIEVDGKEGRKIAIKIDSDGSNQVFEMDGDIDTHVNVITLDDMKNLEDIDVRIEKIIEGESVEAILEAFSDDDVIILKNKSNLEITDVQKGDFGKKSLVDKSEKLDEADLSISATMKSIKVKYPLQNESKVKISAYDANDELIYTSIDPSASDNVNHSVDISHWEKGDYWIELVVDKERLTRKVTVKD